MHSYIRPNTYIALRLPSGTFKVIEITPNLNINLGKYGSFPAKLLLGRPYYLTFEILDKDDGKDQTELRVVPAAELHAEALGSDHATPAESRDESADGGVEFDIVGEDGEVIMRSNRLTIDDPSRQMLSMEEIKELKKAGTGSGKDIIAKIMASHMAIDEKTSFSLAKYTLRKARKYLRRFTVLALDVGMLTEYIIEKESYKIMELREETLGLISSWANIHYGASSRVMTAEDGVSQIGGGRWLVVDDTGGLVVAALAEKMGILYPNREYEEEASEKEQESVQQTAPVNVQKTPHEKPNDAEELSEQTPIQNSQNEEKTVAQQQNGTDIPMPDADTIERSPTPVFEPTTSAAPTLTPLNPTPRPRKPPRPHIPQMSSPTNTLTIVHTNNQPNLSLLKYFNFDHGNPLPSHPLYKHLKSLSWLQLLYPHEDPSYVEPEVLSDEVLAGMKSSKRGNYYKKRRRWEKTARVVDETRRGGFDGLVVASSMEPTTILRDLVPLVRGGGRVVVYSPNVEPLAELCDYYSKERRGAYVTRRHDAQQNGSKITKEVREEEVNGAGHLEDEDEMDPDFPVNPTLLMAPSLQTARARHWQVLPGRTHPLMTSRGGAEGYLFTATRVLPVEGKVEARGNFRGKKRKTGPETAVKT
ncbi:Gcd10p-domain-containing protein [Zopfia rhizophila CBS 207.26]|uniref:tRNA (adenine(58)-N(1))-methyltransferase non-catalytic subunit TRM6 n=1 Tax=Zopfia rhizophila CBS 207.26 TaxID=1314779 RepID=A0A6A6DQ66_9PEZI|nr:Gcd10p-domain-containing protein [Zopfia rhizophila CBS 207.26]